MTGAPQLSRRPVHLGAAGSATGQPPFPDGEAMAQWYAAYESRHAGDGADGRLVSMHTFTKDWDAWEMHPAGDEVVVCTHGAVTLVQQTDAGERRTRIAAGEYAINPAGVWHTADVEDAATCLFITPGQGTAHRARQLSGG